MRPNARAKLQGSPIGARGAAARNSGDSLSASAFVRQRARRTSAQRYRHGSVGCVVAFYNGNAPQALDGLENPPAIALVTLALGSREEVARDVNALDRKLKMLGDEWSEFRLELPFSGRPWMNANRNGRHDESHSLWPYNAKWTAELSSVVIQLPHDRSCDGSRTICLAPVRDARKLLSSRKLRGQVRQPRSVDTAA